MSTEVMKFEDAVKERLKGIVAELIPEERWGSIVRQCVDEFERKDLPQLINAELTAFYKGEIGKVFASPEWQSKWNMQRGEQCASEMVTKLIIDSAPEILSAMIGQTVQQIIYQLRTQMQTRY